MITVHKNIDGYNSSLPSQLTNISRKYRGLLVTLLVSLNTKKFKKADVQIVVGGETRSNSKRT
jgi:hypothetical protein